MASSFDIPKGPNERFLYHANLRKLTKSNGSRITDPVLKPFYIVDDVEQRNISLKHRDGQKHIKSMQLNGSCSVSANAGGEFSNVQWTIKLKSLEKHAQVYQSNEDDYEHWFCWLRYILRSNDQKNYLPVTIPSSSSVLPAGPALLDFHPQTIMVYQPSTNTMVLPFLVKRVTEFGTTSGSLFFDICYFCAKRNQAPGMQPCTRHHFNIEPELAITFIQWLKEEGKRISQGCWSTTKSLGDESFLLNHAAICEADTSKIIHLSPPFLRDAIAPKFRTTWPELASAAGSRIADIAMLESKAKSNQAAEFLQTWLDRLPPSTRSQPKALLALVEGAGMEKEALELRTLYLDASHAEPAELDEAIFAPVDYALAGAGGPQTRAPTVTRGVAAQRPLPPQPVDIPSQPNAARRQTVVERSVEDDKHPLSKVALVELASKVAGAGPGLAELLCRRLLREATVDQIEAEGSGAQGFELLKKCLLRWKECSTPGLQLPTAENLISALQSLDMHIISRWYLGAYPGLAYDSSNVVSPVLSPNSTPGTMSPTPTGHNGYVSPPPSTGGNSRGARVASPERVPPAVEYQNQRAKERPPSVLKPRLPSPPQQPISPDSTGCSPTTPLPASASPPVPKRQTHPKPAPRSSSMLAATSHRPKPQEPEKQRSGSSPVLSPVELAEACKKSALATAAQHTGAGLLTVPGHASYQPPPLPPSASGHEQSHSASNRPAVRPRSSTPAPALPPMSQPRERKAATLPRSLSLFIADEQETEASACYVNQPTVQRVQDAADDSDSGSEQIPPPPLPRTRRSMSGSQLPSYINCKGQHVDDSSPYTEFVRKHPDTP